MISSDNTLKDGVGTPYLALFNEEGTPVKDYYTGVPLGAYISNFTYKFDEEKENQATLTFDYGDPDIIDHKDLQEGSTLYLQWGYIYQDGTSFCNSVRSIKVKDLNCKFDSNGVHVTIKCVDGVSVLKHLPPHRPMSQDEEDETYEGSMVQLLDNGCGYNIGVIIEYFG